MSVLTATHHTLNFNSLSFDKFEELCFWLVDETGEYELVEHFGGGGDKNRDVVGYTPEHELDYFQCKRYRARVCLGSGRCRGARRSRNC